VTGTVLNIYSKQIFHFLQSDRKKLELQLACRCCNWSLDVTYGAKEILEDTCLRRKGQSKRGEQCGYMQSGAT